MPRNSAPNEPTWEALEELEAQTIAIAQRLAAMDPDIRYALTDMWRIAYRRGHDNATGVRQAAGGNPFDTEQMSDYLRSRRNLRRISEAF